MFVCFLVWVYVTAGCLTLIRSRSSYNHNTPTCILVRLCMYIFVLVLIVFLSIPSTWLPTSLFLLDTIQEALCEQQPVVGPATGHFRRAFIASVSVRVSRGWVLRYCAWVKVLIFHHYLACICLCFSCCLCVYLFPPRKNAFIHTHTSMQVCFFLFLSTRDSWLPNSDSLSLLIQSHIPTCILVCVCMYIFVLFVIVLLSLRYSWLPNSLFLLDTGSFICTTTSCRPCHLTFSPGFHRLCECACFSWLSTEILCLSESVDFPSLFDMYLPVLLVLLVCVCKFLSHGVHWQTNRHSRKISEILPAHRRAHTHAEISLTQPSVVTSVTLIRSRSSYTYTYTDT
jgi:hypothetical protein